MITKVCELCGYEWNPRKDNPVSCPRCKRRFDYPKVGDMLKNGEDRRP